MPGIDILDLRADKEKVNKVADLEKKRARLYEEMSALGDFRSGTISVNFRKCGKRTCACAQPGHPGHGPQYLWTASTGGRRGARALRFGAELEEVRKQILKYREFRRLSRELVEINERICELRPVPVISDAQILRTLTARLRRHFPAKRPRK